MNDGPRVFDGLAETYDAYRPPYPPEIFADLVTRLPAAPRCAVDVGAGTGLSTQGLIDALPADWLVVGVEPGADMRRVMIRRFRAQPNFQANASMAEALRLPGASASLVLAGTAFHWFDPAAFQAEAARVLVPGGVLAFVRNVRRREGVIAAIDDWILSESRRLGMQAPATRKMEPTLRDLTALAGFGRGHSRRLAWESETDARGLIDLYLTRARTAALVRALGLPCVVRRLEALVAEHHGTAPFRLAWETRLKWCARRAG